MECDKIADEAHQGDMLDVLYGEADVAAEARVREHLLSCAACRDEMAALQGLRRHLGAWRVPSPRPAFSPRGFVVPRWLAAAALVLLAFTATLGTSAYLSLSRALRVQEARALELEERQQRAQRALEAALARRVAVPAAADDALLQQLDAHVDARLRESQDQQLARIDQRFADWRERAEVRRRVDMAQVAASLSYLDGRHGEQLARTNELMGYVLQASQKR